MKTTKLAILTAFILFAFSFTFSSCKNCNGNKGKDIDPVLNDSDLTEDGNKGKDIDPVLNDSDLTEVGKYLKRKGASDTEIREMMKIEKEDFGSDITDINRVGRIVYDTNHYYYRDSNGYPHNGQSGDGNCGLYAMKRLLFVLGKHGIIGKNLWYENTDKDLRGMVVKMTGAGKYKHHSEMIGAPILRTLMRDNLNVLINYCEVYDRSGYSIEGGFMPPLLSLSEKNVHEAATEKKAMEFEAAAKAAQIQAETAKGNVKTIEMAMNEVNKVAEEVTVWRNRMAIRGIYGSEGFTVKEIMRMMDAQNAVEKSKRIVQDIANTVN
jgi:hypothetical protein